MFFKQKSANLLHSESDLHLMSCNVCFYIFTSNTEIFLSLAIGGIFHHLYDTENSS